MLQFWLNLLILVYIAKGSEIGGVRFCPGARPSPSLARYLCLSATFLILPIAQTSNTSDICYVTSTATLVLHSQADLDALSPCTIFTGDIAINGDIGVNTPTPTESALALPTGLTTILGRLDISSLPNLVQLNASHLENITTGISMQNLNNLKAVFLQNLRASGIYFELVQLPALAQLGIGNFSLPVDGASFGIYGTQLPAMPNVSCNNVAFCEVEANQYITSISQPGLMNASFITILYNSPDLSLNLPDLLTSGHTSFGNMDGVNIKVLQNTSDHLTFGNASLTNISAPELISVGRDLEIGNCIDLTTLYFPKLQTISRNFLIEGNPSLEMISGFPSLTTIGGDLDWTGAFNNASSLPQLKSIGGALNVQSSSRELRCPFPQLRTNGVIHGHGFVCTGGVTDPDSIINGINVTADNLTPAANNTNDHGLSRGAIGGISVAVSVGFVILSLLAYIGYKTLREQQMNNVEEDLDNPPTEGTGGGRSTGQTSPKDKGKRPRLGGRLELGDQIVDHDPSEKKVGEGHDDDAIEKKVEDVQERVN